MAGVLAVLYAIDEVPTSGLSVRLGVIFAAGVVILALFVWRQLRITYPLIRMSFFRKPDVLPGHRDPVLPDIRLLRRLPADADLS